jgi:hypothetical protein
MVGDDVTGALNQLEPVTCRITANQLYQHCVSFRFTLPSGFTRRDFLRTGCGNPRPPQRYCSVFGRGRQ